jgi:hypothetical protein
MAWQALLVCGALLASSVMHAKDHPRQQAAELIRAMRADRLAAERVELMLLDRCKAEGCDADHRACLRKPHPEDFVEHFSSRLARELSAEELRAALDYFESEVGDKHIGVLRGEVGLSRETLFNQQPEDRARMLAWLDTKPGYLLMTRGFLTRTSEINNWIAVRARRAWSECLGPAGLQPTNTASEPMKSP